MQRSANSHERERFALGWLKMPGRRAEEIGSVLLPCRPSTLGEARGGLEMRGDDEPAARWLAAWAESAAEERDVLLQLPGGWFELTNATIAKVPGAEGRYVVRFDRRSAAAGPE